MQAAFLTTSPHLPAVPPLGTAVIPLTSMADADPLWKLIVQLLPPKDVETEWFTTSEVAPLVGLRPESLMKHCRDLWPNWEGQYRLNFGQAQSLIRRVCLAGRKVPSRAQVEQLLKQRRSKIQ